MKIVAVLTFEENIGSETAWGEDVGSETVKRFVARDLVPLVKLSTWMPPFVRQI